ncbi:MAG TPA: NRDE family protein [Planctomycetota bacterium]|nr:NRDE family protein [Planctomycetota bacterium]
MCTLTWLLRDDGYFVAFSRDERRTRAPATGPKLFERAGVKGIAPIDGEAGGTWIAVNEQGLTLALLNGYRFQGAQAQRADERRTWSSRGELALQFGDAASVAEVATRLSEFDLERYRPFELAAFDTAGAATLASWTGSTLITRELHGGDRPLVSSSFDDDGARVQRRAQYAKLVSGEASEHELERFHSSHAPSRGAYSPCMHREDAHTVSFTRVRVGARQVELLYQPLSPCESMPVERVEIQRRAVARS